MIFVVVIYSIFNVLLDIVMYWYYYVKVIFEIW